MPLETRNTFLNFFEHKSINSPPPFGRGALRRCCSDPCTVASASKEAVDPLASRKPELNDLAVFDSCKVFVGSLPAQCDESYLSRFMSFFGEVKKVTLKRNQVTGQSRRYGYVKFKSPPHEDLCKQTWALGGKIIRIKRYQVNPCWKQQYDSGAEDTDENILLGNNDF